MVALSNLRWKHNKKEEDDDPLACNENGHHIGNEYQLLSEEEHIEQPGYSHHHNQGCASLDPVPEKEDRDDKTAWGIQKIAIETLPE